jgi:hypothetical protein
VLTLAAIDFEPSVGYVTTLSAAVVAAQNKVHAPHWQGGPATYVLRATQERYLLVLAHNRFLAQSLSLHSWHKNLEAIGWALHAGLEAMGVKELKRIGFKASAFLPVKLSHRDIKDLMFESFLAPRAQFTPICGDVEDLLLQVHGEYKGMKAVLVLAPVTQEQSIQALMQTPNLEMFLEPKLLDTGVLDFRNRLDGDSFYVDIDLSKTETVPDAVPAFLAEGLATAEEIVESTVRRLRSMPKKGS